jgi:hypothetical protein
MQSKITDVQIRHWLRAGKPVAKAQGEVAGLTFTLSARGTQSRMAKRLIGNRSKPTTSLLVA